MDIATAAKRDEDLSESFILLFVFLNGNISYYSGFVIYFDKFSTEFAFGDETLFLLAITLGRSLCTFMHGYLFFACQDTLGFAEWTDGHVVEVKAEDLKARVVD